MISRVSGGSGGGREGIRVGSPSRRELLVSTAAGIV